MYWIENKVANLHERFNLKTRSPPSTNDYSGKVNPNITFTFSDPKIYKGPVVQGWEPGIW
jgi:hypothetical protein